MEYIEGENLQEYSDRRSLGIRARLTLFLQVCAGVRYAHQGLVVHRDIKPGNILVTADGIPKLLDFGLAKLIHSEASRTELTAVGNRAFTPQYASPEQVRGERITMSTDIFSLGLVLYELLSGSHPYGKEMTSTPALLTAICEKPPPPPMLLLARASPESSRAISTRSCWPRSRRTPSGAIRPSSSSARTSGGISMGFPWRPEPTRSSIAPESSCAGIACLSRRRRWPSFP